MAAAASGAAAFQWLIAQSPSPKVAGIRLSDSPLSLSSPAPRPLCSRRRMLSAPRAISRSSSSSKSDPTTTTSSETAPSGGKREDEERVEVEEELPWIQEKALDLVEFTGSVTQAIPGPRVGTSSLPLILAIPLAYAGITFVIAFVKALRKFNSPREKRKKLVNKNATLCRSIDELFEKGKNEVEQSDLKQLMQKTGFDMKEILRKYIRYALNEKEFNPAMVSGLIQLRKASMLEDSQVAEILNDISTRIVRDKGPVAMDITGYSRKGAERKLAVKALFGKVFYLSEIPEFCSRDSSLGVREIFGVTDEDVEKLRIPGSQVVDVDSLHKMMDGSGAEDPKES